MPLIPATNSLVIDKIDSQTYSDKRHGNGVSEPSVVVAQTPYGAWRLEE